MKMSTLEDRLGPAEQKRREELLAQARALAPRLRQRAAWTDETGSVHPDTVRELNEGTLYRILQPRRFGGYELDLVTLVDVTAELARGCASTAWVWGNLAAHHWWVGVFDPRAQDEIWRDSNDVLVASSGVAARSRATAVPGGFRLSGQWSYSSGVELSGWNMLAVRVFPSADQEQEPPKLWFFLLPEDDYRIVRNWDVSGLRGTGSHDILVEDAFVPAHRAVPQAKLRGGDTPGSAANPGRLFRLPLIATGPLALSGVALGLAEETLALAETFVRSQQSFSGGVPLATLPPVQAKLARAAALIESGRLLMRSAAAAAWKDAGAPEAPPVLRRLGYRSHTAHAVGHCHQAINLAVDVLGARALARSEPIERILRDIQAVASSLVFNTDFIDPLYAQASLGLLADHPSI